MIRHRSRRWCQVSTRQCGRLGSYVHCGIPIWCPHGHHCNHRQCTSGTYCFSNAAAIERSSSDGARGLLSSARRLSTSIHSQQRLNLSRTDFSFQETMCASASHTWSTVQYSALIFVLSLSAEGVFFNVPADVRRPEFRAMRALSRWASHSSGVCSSPASDSGKAVGTSWGKPGPVGLHTCHSVPSDVSPKMHNLKASMFLTRGVFLTRQFKKLINLMKNHKIINKNIKIINLGILKVITWFGDKDLFS